MSAPDSAPAEERLQTLLIHLQLQIGFNITGGSGTLGMGQCSQEHLTSGTLGACCFPVLVVQCEVHLSGSMQDRICTHQSTCTPLELIHVVNLEVLHSRTVPALLQKTELKAPAENRVVPRSRGQGDQGPAFQGL